MAQRHPIRTSTRGLYELAFDRAAKNGRRHALGIGLRGLRPIQSACAKVPGRLDGDILGRRVRQGCGGRTRNLVYRIKRLAFECG